MELEVHNKTFQHSKFQACRAYLDVIKEWLKNCSQAHQMLRLSSYEFSSPARLLDLGWPGCQRLRLVTSGQSAITAFKYTARSYCLYRTWIPKTASINFEHHLQKSLGSRPLRPIMMPYPRHLISVLDTSGLNPFVYCKVTTTNIRTLWSY